MEGAESEKLAVGQQRQCASNCDAPEDLAVPRSLRISSFEATWRGKTRVRPQQVQSGQEEVATGGFGDDAAPCRGGLRATARLRSVEKGVFDLLTMIPRLCAGEGGVENVGDGGATEI